jgi:putative peptide zinc metalloprotease protein
MRLGRTSLRLSGLLASGLRRRKLRQDLKVNRQVIEGEATYVVKIPDPDQYLRCPETGWQVLSLFDGTRTDREVWEELKRQDLDLPFAEVEDFADGCDPILWERTLTEKNLALLEKIRGERQERASDQSVFYMYFSAWDPDAFFNRVIPWLRWIWTRKFVCASLALILVGGVFFVYDFERILHDTVAFYTFTGKSATELWDFWLLLLVIGFIHECAHGLSVKAYGGECHQMGFLLVYFTPAFYTDSSDMFLFDKDYKRLWTIFAGVWIEMTLCATALVVWSFTAPGSFVSDWSYKLMLMTSITSVVFNLNPLMKYDGYLALCQILGLDNLREESLEYVQKWAAHYLSLGRLGVERASRRKHRIFLIYGTLCFMYSALVTLIVLVWVRNFTTQRLGAWGFALTAAFAWLLVRQSARDAFAFARQQISTYKEAAMRLIASPRRRAAALAAGAFVLLFPFRTTVHTELVLEPAARVEVRTPVDGVVGRVLVRNGDEVEPGAVLAVLRNPDVVAREEVLSREVRIAEQALRQSQAEGELGEAERRVRELERLRPDWEDVKRKRLGLELRSPLRGAVATNEIEQRVGEWLRPGDAMAVVSDRRVMKARVLVPDADIEDVGLGAPAALHLNAYPMSRFSGQVRQILPAAARDRPVSRPTGMKRDGQDLYNYFAVVLELPNGDGRLREGMTGTARIEGPRRSLAWQGLRAAWRWTRSQVWL